MLYILLIIIAVGVLLISEPGKGILRWIGGLAVIGGAVFLGFALVVGGVSLISYNGEGIKNFATAIPLLIGMFLIWTFVFIAAPDRINELFKNPNHKKIFWTIFFLCILILFIYRIYMNYHYPLL